MSEDRDALERFQHVPFRVELELGRIVLDIQTVLRLAEGDVLRTGQRAGSGMRVVAGGVHIGSAEMISVNNRAAARITSISALSTRGGPRGDL